MFKQNDGLWYFKYKDDRGRWRTYATHTRSEEEAREIEEVFKGNERITVPETVTGLLEMFTIPERNPDYLDARITGRNYGERHAKEVARNMKDLSELVSVRGGIGRIQLQKVTRVQCKMAMTKIHEKWGNTDKARKMFSEFKACLTYAQSLVATVVNHERAGGRRHTAEQGVELERIGGKGQQLRAARSKRVVGTRGCHNGHGRKEDIKKPFHH